MEKVMITELDKTKCNGCGVCIDICPMDVIRPDNDTQKASICYPEDCTNCYLCEMNCAAGAIFVDPISIR
jgi:NAD-dependent dihydropyrimidine dehydrogenase PreA subunit